MGQLPLTALFGSFLFWVNFYFILSIFNYRHSPEWNCRVVTFFHGFLATFLSFLSSFITGPFPFTYVGKPSTPFHIAIIVISFGYFLFDFCWCIYYLTEGPLMLAHHVVSIFGFLYILYTGMSGCELVAVVGGSEASNPLLQIRWFMKAMGLYSGTAAKAIDYMFVAVFVGVRLGMGTALALRTQLDFSVDWIARLGGLAFYTISLLFGVQIISFFYCKYIVKRK